MWCLCNSVQNLREVPRTWNQWWSAAVLWTFSGNSSWPIQRKSPSSWYNIKRIMVSVVASIISVRRFKYSETSIYCSQIIRFPGSVVQFLWSLSESYLNYGSRIYCLPGSIISFFRPPTKTMNRGFTVPRCYRRQQLEFNLGLTGICIERMRCYDISWPASNKLSKLTRTRKCTNLH
jgi:hypothetical protein